MTRLFYYFEYKTEQIITDRNINESDPLVKVANITSTLIYQTLLYMPTKIINIVSFFFNGEPAVLNVQGSLYQFE